MNKKKTLYYSLCKLIYNTDLERHEIELIKSKFPDYRIINPNGAIDYQSIIDCYWTIDDVSNSVFLTIEDLIGRGIYSKIEYSLKRGKLLYWLWGNRFYRKFVLNSNDPDDWKLDFGNASIN